MSRSNPASFAPAVPLPTDYLQLPAPVSTSSGSQQLRLCDQGVCKPDIAVKEVELLADVGPWLKESTCTMVSEQVQEYRSASHVHGHGSTYSRLHLRISRFIPDPSQRSGEPQRQRDRGDLPDAPATRSAARQFCGR